MTSPAWTPLVLELARQLAAHYPAWEAADLEPVGAGVSYLVCRASTAPFGTVAIRVPLSPTSEGPNDGPVAVRPFLQQEAVIASHVRAHGIPVPAVHALHLGGDGFDFLVSAFVEQDGSPPDARAFGRLVRRIHTCPVPAIVPAGQGDQPLSRTIAARLARRAEALADLAGVALPLPPVDALACVLAARDGHRALLHMDARPANLFTRWGEIVAIADWDNALIGDPALELARVAESGLLDAGFLAGYGDEPSLDRLPHGVATIYRLDTAVMLALVFLAEAPDPELAPVYIDRAKELAAAL